MILGLLFACVGAIITLLNIEKKIGGVNMSLFKERSDQKLALRDLADKIARDIEGISANGVSDDLAPEARYASEMIGSSEEKAPQCGKQ